MQDALDRERRALRQIIDSLNDLEPDARARILRTAQTFFGLDSLAGLTPPAVLHSHPHYQAAARDLGAPTFATRTELSPKEFVVQKQPTTDVERVACLAYYLTHYRSMPHFRTIDISKLNTEAAQVKFANPAYAVANASNAGLLVPAGKGNKQVSARGEKYVEALPDRAAAKAVSVSLRSRKTRRRNSSKT